MIQVWKSHENRCSYSFSFLPAPLWERGFHRNSYTHKKSKCLAPGDSFFPIQIKICYCFYPVEISVLIFLGTALLPYPWFHFPWFRLIVANHRHRWCSFWQTLRRSVISWHHVTIHAPFTSPHLTTQILYHLIASQEGWVQYKMLFWESERPHSHFYYSTLLKLFYFIISYY